MVTADPELSAKTLAYDYGIVGERRDMHELVDAGGGIGRSIA